VRDNGIGLRAEEIPSLFNMFSQLAAPERSGGGLGIGLALVRGLVELHGGVVQASSPGLGQGSTFTVRLPLTQAGHTHAATASSAPGAQPELCRILVIDDNVDAAETVGELLRLMGHFAVVAHSGAQGVNLAREHVPDIALVDLGMPGMDGLSVARLLRADPATADIALVALTGWGQKDDRERTRQAGFVDHLTKPVDPAEFHALLQSHGAARH